MEKIMNNINIKAKKTRTLNSMRYLEINSKYDPLYANLYSLMATKRTAKLTKHQLKIKLASLYDGRLSVISSVDNNIICIRYTLTSIMDQYLPQPISSEVDCLFADVLAGCSFSDEEIIATARELSLYVKSFYDNKQNIANSKLAKLIDVSGLQLSSTEIIDFYQNPDVSGVKNWMATLDACEQVNLNFNSGDEHVTQTSTKLNYQPKDYKRDNGAIIDLKLDQTYLAFGYKLASTNVTINNLANLIFGGGVYSKLFKVVREEHNLSYNIRSTLQTENLITISGGVNNEKLELAESEIDKQIASLKKGQFEAELELAKTNYIENLKRSKSNEMAYISMYGDNYLKGANRTHQSIIEEINNVTSEDIQAVFNQMELLTKVYVK